ncbi:hypothetical protein [Acanthamoeba polyphaga mimivirus]|nr:hypothetical protein [Acanthamoeba castellanii mamavirus]UMZ08468.1 hypothetical protein [Acanthamoeba polyphaga mimivirus]
MENQIIVDEIGQCDPPNNKPITRSPKIDTRYRIADSISSIIRSPPSNIWYTNDRGAIGISVVSIRISNTNPKN